MELSTIIGLTLGVLAVAVGMLLKGASLTALMNPAAFMIIIVGTAATLFIAFPMHELKRFPALVKVLFRKKEGLSKADLIMFFKQLAGDVRREGLLSIESKIDSIPDPFMKSGLQMIVDATEEDMVRDILMEEVYAMEKRHKAGALIFTQAGTYAPTLGVLGAVVGLIAALGNLSDIEKLGSSIAAAFVATLLGIFTGYVIWHPSANKLKRLSAEEMDMKVMIVEGVLSLTSGVSPAVIEQKLLAFVSNTEKAQILANAGGAANGEKKAQTRTA